MSKPQQAKEVRTPFPDFVFRLRTISQLAEEESTALAGLYPGKEDGCSIDPSVIFEPHPCKRAMVAFLDSLPRPVLYSLLALMYSGRDNYKDPVKHFRAIWPTFTKKELAIVKIVEKFPRMKYIDAALSNMSEGDITALPNIIGQIVEHESPL